MRARTSSILVLGTTFALALATGGCAKKKLTEMAVENREVTTYEIQCGKAEYPGMYSTEEPPKIPDQLPVVRVPIDVQSCPGLDDGPHFFAGEMPGLVAIVDCNAKLVRFRTRNWQVNEAANIDPDGRIDLRLMYITRFLNDAQDTPNCWTRLLGHVRGHVSCNASDPNGARFNFNVVWTVDETPPEVMEPPSPGLADLRNGKHCKLKPGNCIFSNTASMGCGG